ncbi:MAG: RNase adapter RapZ [Acetivibrio ethanolgignens]
MRCIIVTGMSGAGKSSALHMLEDSGFFCVDNMPVPLLGRMVEMVAEGSGQIEKLALGIDVRNGEALAGLREVLGELEKGGYQMEVLFLEASTQVLVKRFKETRRTHPLTGVGRVDKGIELERKQLEFLRHRADYVIDTSHLLVRELKGQVDRIAAGEGGIRNFFITVLSFGFKYGIPADADLIFDVRFLPNPYYLPELKEKTGRDKKVYDYVMSSPEAGVFLDKLEDMLTFLIPNYINEGKNQLVIGIGCTGGRHRSVTLARAIHERLKPLEYGMKLEHRDAEK